MKLQLQTSLKRKCSYNKKPLLALGTTHASALITSAQRSSRKLSLLHEGNPNEAESFDESADDPNDDSAGNAPINPPTNATAPALALAHDATTSAPD